MNQNESRSMVPVGENGGNVKFAKLRPLKPTEIEKGFYQAVLPGESISGVYTGSKANTFDVAKTDFTIERQDGSKLVITGAGNLTTRLSSVEPGTYVEITYRGKATIKNGPYKGKESHLFDVLKEDAA